MRSSYRLKLGAMQCNTTARKCLRKKDSCPGGINMLNTSLISFELKYTKPSYMLTTLHDIRSIASILELRNSNDASSKEGLNGSKISLS